MVNFDFIKSNLARVLQFLKWLDEIRPGQAVNEVEVDQREGKLEADIS